MNRAQLIVSDACIGCGRCINVCPGGILHMGADGKPCIQDFDEFGWNGCWQCQHCLAVCPKAAVSVLGRRPEDSMPMPDPTTAEPVMDALVAGRRSCRRYLHRDVPRETIDEMLELLANAPNGGNKQLVEYTLVDSAETMDRLRALARAEMERLADEGIYPEGYDEQSYGDLKRWEKAVRPDMLFCGAPHILIPHAPLGHGEPVQDVIIAGTHFELLCTSRGLGAVMMTFPLDVLALMPNVRTLLGLPEDHYVGMIAGFGYPQIPYARTTQRRIDEGRIHRLSPAWSNLPIALPGRS